MIIHIQQSGGFSGVSRSIKVDTESIPQSDAIRIRRLMKECDFHKELSECAAKVTIAKNAADYFNYSLSIVENQKKQQIECNELTMSSNLKKLINYLIANSKKWNE